nr:uncharacterized protein LOC124495427 [Dermatophagoides farinae]
MSATKKLGQKCQHSAQCYSMITGSGCYRPQQQQQQKRKQSLNVDDDQWHCSCAFGYKVDQQKQECINEWNIQEPDHEQCDQMDGGYLWIPILRKCVATDRRIHYSMRVGRAGGGRGGGGGGSVGRSTGSRSWFSNRRNGIVDYRSNISTILMVSMLSLLLILM